MQRDASALATTHSHHQLSLSHRFWRWFLEGMKEGGRHSRTEATDAWWKVMTLTGVDYFSSLGYAPGIAFLAAGPLSPIATIILVLLTLAGALPIYSKVAEESPHGQGSISMLERLMPQWKGKLLVLSLLGFAATDFIITITLSAADGATHLIENPMLKQMQIMDHMTVTVIMLFVLSAVFLKGFREAISVCIWIVAIYLALNCAVVGKGLWELGLHPEKVGDWWTMLNKAHGGSILSMLGISCLLFPKLALGMSGFETGVAVMPHVEGSPDDEAERPRGRIRHTRYLLISAAAIMSFFLIGSAVTTTVLIPDKEFQAGGAANGRALAYMAHHLLPEIGTLYDISTISILWFAGASAMAGLLNLVPRYLPRYGMAPQWARATRPLVLVFTAVGLVVTWWFKADVDAQGGAYATGVLVLMTSAALACTLVVWKAHPIKRIYFLLITCVFVYTTIANSIERPDGIRIAGLFIGFILLASLTSRVMRSTELRERKVVFDPLAEEFLKEDASSGLVRIVAHRPGGIDYYEKEAEARETHNLEGPFLFLEVSIKDASDFKADQVEVHGVRTSEGFRILRCESAAVPNTIARLLLDIRDHCHTVPHLYVGWTEGNPVVYILKYLIFGEGETAPVTREILREAEHDPARRPRVHVG